MNFLKETIVVAFIAFLVVVQGVNGKFNCHYCSRWETEADCNGNIECDAGVTVCVLAKGVETGGQVKYKKGCQSSAQDCNDVHSLCGRTGSSITCLAGGCCNSTYCDPKQLKVLPMPSSSVKPSSSESKTSSAKQMAMKSSVVSASPTMQSSAPQTTTAEAVAAAAATTTMTTTKTTATETSMMASSKEVIAKATETSMKGMMGSPTVKVSEALVPHSRSPNQGNTRPTCKDSSGMRHVLSPLAILFVAAGLVNLFL